MLGEGGGFYMEVVRMYTHSSMDVCSWEQRTY